MIKSLSSIPKNTTDSLSSLQIEKGSFDIRFLETRLTPDTYKLAEGCDVVCVFVNDDINSFVIDQLYAMGIKLIALRCAGYNKPNMQFG